MKFCREYKNENRLNCEWSKLAPNGVHLGFLRGFSFLGLTVTLVWNYILIGVTGSGLPEVTRGVLVN